MKKKVTLISSSELLLLNTKYLDKELLDDFENENDVHVNNCWSIIITMN